REELEKDGLILGAGLQALAELLRNVVPLYVMCDPRDFHCMPMVRSPHDQRPTIYIYDRYPGGIGIARRCFAIERKLFTAAMEILGGCRCADGCPSCIGPSLELGHKGKATAHVLLHRILSSAKAE
ncbi:MAG TPA: DUF1998 domain-containing protein, partial [Candidatus Sumerlaeota bacterium]|nr:DUF1998 domain-containing protein [Candidatus Sumerlaeota bacterium]